MRYFKPRAFVEGNYANVGRCPGRTWDTKVAGISGSIYYTWGQGNARGEGLEEGPVGLMLGLCSRRPASVRGRGLASLVSTSGRC